MTCNRRRGTGKYEAVEVYPVQMYEVYCGSTARVIATFECRKEAERYANTINAANGRAVIETSKHERCCQDD